MSRIHVVVAATRNDIEAEAIAAAIATRPDMTLVGGRHIGISEAATTAGSLPDGTRRALILYGPADDTAAVSEQALRENSDLAVLRITSAGDIRIGATLHQMGLPELLVELGELVDRVCQSGDNRAPVFQLRPVAPRDVEAVAAGPLRTRPLMSLAVTWIHALYSSAVEDLPEISREVHWFNLTKATVLHELGLRVAGTSRAVPANLAAADRALVQKITASEVRNDPLALLFHKLDLTFPELHVVLLALAPELDLVYQRCVGLLLDDMSHRAGTLGLFASLLGPAAEVRTELELSGGLGRWRLLEPAGDRLPSADESLRLDAPVIGWLLGNQDCLAQDPYVQRVLRVQPWGGVSILKGDREQAEATQLVRDVLDAQLPKWILLDGGEPATWRALFELGAQSLGVQPLRVELCRIGAMQTDDIKASALRLGRLVRMTGLPAVLDTLASGVLAVDGEAIATFLRAFGDTGAHAAVLSAEPSRVARIVEPDRYRMRPMPLGEDTRIWAIRLAARGADAYLTEAEAATIAAQYPLQINGFEHAMQLAKTKADGYDARHSQQTRFLDACKEVAAESLSRLAERIDPIFSIDDVVLPEDRKQQLTEIVHNIRFAPKVLDAWKFRDQLPYGRGVAVLFHGPSGVGKTMAAMGIAKALGIHILRLDLSRVVSKYIGDTEKNIDQVFLDAQRSGSAILIDEADALLGKRSEVKDAHDRHANIEVAYLLQRMEAYEGLAVLTTNLRQNLDPAFLRRLRFIVEFPRPDAVAREQIWRQCLPESSHALSDAAFHQLARRIDLTGGHIRQITLRAAFIAAAAGSLIRLEHIAHASRAEFAKLGMPPVELDAGTPRRVA